MKTYTMDLSAKNLGKMKCWPTRKDATSAGNGQLTFSSEEDILGSGLPMPLLVGVFNAANVGADPINRFADRPTAAKRLFALAQAKAIMMEEGKQPMTNPDVEPEKETVAKRTKLSTKAPKKEKKAPREKKEGAARAGRTSALSGMKLYPIAKENPRREGSLGWLAFEIIRKKPGITYDDYIAAGGEGKHLRWEIDREHVDAR
jgi:hypothetical protein